jgi:hypothetical protein
MPDGMHRDPRDESYSDRVKRREASRHRLATESWPEFFKGYAIQIALIAAGVALLALVFWLLR